MKLPQSLSKLLETFNKEDKNLILLIVSALLAGLGAFALNPVIDSIIGGVLIFFSVIFFGLRK